MLRDYRAQLRELKVSANPAVGANGGVPGAENVDPGTASAFKRSQGGARGESRGTVVSVDGVRGRARLVAV